MNTLLLLLRIILKNIKLLLCVYSVREVPWQDAGCFCVASHWPTSALKLTASPSFTPHFSCFIKPAGQLSTDTTRQFVTVADVFVAFVNVVTFGRFGVRNEGFSARCFLPGRGDTDRSGNLICMPRPLHLRHKQLSLAASNPAGERKQLWFWGFFLCCPIKCFGINPAPEETQARRVKPCGWNVFSDWSEVRT